MSLRQSVAFDFPTTVPDGYGGEVDGWTSSPDSYECRAQMIYWRGMEAEDAAQLVGRERYKVKIRASAKAKTITNVCRMRDLRSGATYNIKQVDNTTQVGWVFFVLEHGTAS